MAAQVKIRFPLGVKLSLIISGVLLLSFSVITLLMVRLVGADVRLTAENNNWTLNRWSANEGETILSGLKAKALLLIRSLDSRGAANPGDLIDLFYRLNPEISGVAFAGSGETPGGLFLNNRFGIEDPLFNPSRISAWFASREEEVRRAASGETLLFNGFPYFKSPLLVMLFPLPRQEGFSFAGAAGIFFSAAGLSASVLKGGDGGNTGFIVNGAGEVLAHEDRGLVQAGAKLDGLPIVR
ncbi:MAG: hypothetical protein LBQ61_10685, partial [Spirochaetales bacterium]|nr:hypothetical protein [Spirochaetales bacterium]